MRRSECTSGSMPPGPYRLSGFAMLIRLRRYAAPARVLLMAKKNLRGGPDCACELGPRVCVCVPACMRVRVFCCVRACKRACKRACVRASAHAWVCGSSVPPPVSIPQKRGAGRARHCVCLRVLTSGASTRSYSCGRTWRRRRGGAVNGRGGLRGQQARQPRAARISHVLCMFVCACRLARVVSLLLPQRRTTPVRSRPSGATLAAPPLARDPRPAPPHRPSRACTARRRLPDSKRLSNTSVVSSAEAGSYQGSSPAA
jgi:hypothetical protein